MRRGLSTLSRLVERGGYRQRLLRSRLCADDQPRPPSRDPGCSGRNPADDAESGPPLRALRERGLPAHGDAVGRPVSGGADRWRKSYFLSCCRYIELNPVRAAMVRHPRDYAWSSYRAHALGRPDELVSDHPLYRALGRSSPQRQEAYRDLFRVSLDPDFIDSLRAATNGGWALGNDRFKRQIAKAMGRRVAPLPRGRPSKAGKDKRQLNLL